MDEQQALRIINNPDFQTMARKKSSIGMIFSILTLVIYFGFLILVGVDKSLFLIPVSAGAKTTLGIYAGIGIIIFVVVIIAIYVKKANGEFDTLTRKVVDGIQSGRI